MQIPIGKGNIVFPSNENFAKDSGEEEKSSEARYPEEDRWRTPEARGFGSS